MSEQNRDKMKKKGKAEVLLERLAEEIAESMERHMTKDKFNYDYFHAELMWRFNLDSLIPEDNFRVPREVKRSKIEYLLFNDYRGDKKESRTEEALTFLEDILLFRPIQVHSKTNPTSLHNILEEMCKCSRCDGEWESTKISRNSDWKRKDIPGPRKWFDDFGKAIINHRRKLGDRISEIARNARKEFGPFWIEVGEYKEEMGDELRLTDVMMIAPTPLKNEFFCDKNISSFKSIVKTLDEIYGLLKGCGLPPNEWLSKYKDEGLSMGILTELKKLYRSAKEYKDLFDSKYEDAFKEAFKQSIEMKKGESYKRKGIERPSPLKVAGFDEFEEFLDSNVGQAMLNRLESNIISYDDGGESGGENVDDFGVSVEKRNLWEIILNNCHHINCDRVVIEYMKQLLINEVEYAGEWELHEDERFIQLLNSYARYNGLTTNEINETLNSESNKVISTAIIAWDATRNKQANPLVISYIEHVWCKQLPVKGLFTMKSFNTKLAKDPERLKLSEKQLEEWIRNGACRLWDEFLNDTQICVTP